MRAQDVSRTRIVKLDLRVEAFNGFNQAQFYGPSSVDGEVNDPNFGHVVSATAPRLVQIAEKVPLLTFWWRFISERVGG